MSNPSSYGQFYWCIKVMTHLSESGEIYAYADEVTTNPDGSLALLQDKGGTKEVTLLIAAGAWLALYAASALDGSALSVEHWKGELVELGDLDD